MQLLHRAAGHPRLLAVLPGTFNPVTVAHLALAQAALARVEEVLFVLPRAFPHKEYSGASFEDRAAMLRAALGGHPAFSLAASQRGLFVEIARECRDCYGADVQLAFLCGRDAAERAAGWDYGRPGAWDEMLRHFDLLVAAREGEYQPPERLRSAIRRLELTGEYDHVSATEVRERIARGQPWEHLVPPAVRELAREIYRQRT
ncbi:MAG: hypothetical protein LAP87_04740 [Acidobacteriia bacterium]|nr:hypothetical protein [Terriglobia bacterium]